MARRRGRGEGRIEQLPSGNHRAILPGRAKAGRSKTFRAREEAVKWLQKHADARSAAGTVAGWLTDWLEIHEANAAPKTFSVDKYVVEKHVRPALGTIRLRDLDARLVGQWLARMKRDGASDDMRNRAFATLKKILRAHPTLPNGLLEKVKTPTVRRAKKRSMTDGQFRDLVAAADGMAGRAPHLGAMVRVWAECCCRPRELLALQWDDYAGGVLSVRRALCPETGGVKTLKNKYSSRDVPLSPEAASALDAWAGRGYKGGVMFPGTGGGHMAYSTFQDSWGRLTRAAGLDGWTPYEMRHTAASLLVASGESILAIARRMGHVDASMVLRVYGHALPDDQKKLTRVFGRLYSPS